MKIVTYYIYYAKNPTRHESKTGLYKNKLID